MFRTVYTTLTILSLVHVTSHADVEGKPSDIGLAPMHIVMLTPVPAEATEAAKPRAAAAVRLPQMPCRKPGFDDNRQRDRRKRDYARCGRGPGGDGRRGSASPDREQRGRR